MPREPESLVTAIVYPRSDGRPMAESDIRYRSLVDVRERLTARYSNDPNVYVSGNLLVYYEEGRPRVSLAPGGLVVFGVPAGLRDVYKVWEEGKFPDVVFEFTSKTTQREDMEDKFEVYQDVWRVKEYFLFDPRAEYLDPPLVGFRMTRGELQQIRAVRGVVTSKTLGLTLAADGPRLVLRDAATGVEVLTPAEQRATSAEAEVARLRAELAALRKKKPTA